MLGLLTAVIVALVCVLLHFEALLFVDKLSFRIRSGRKMLLTTWGVLLSVHVVEVWLYAGVYYLGHNFGLGRLEGLGNNLDFVYFSGVVYTTLGFGDIVPSGDLRMLAASEALVGLCLIAWSATATFASLRKR